MGEPCRSKEELIGAAGKVRDKRYRVALLGTIAVGKSTAICRAEGLELPSTKGMPKAVLETGAGGITICEVHVRRGPGYGVIVEPSSDEELRRQVAEFAGYLTNPSRPADEDDGAEGGSPGISREVERAIRNMAGFRRRRAERKPDGSVIPAWDEARELAGQHSEMKDLAVEILARMELHRRDRRDIWFNEPSGRPPLEWLQETFEQINNGRPCRIRSAEEDRADRADGRPRSWGVESCDVQLVLLPASAAGDIVRTDGSMIELGFGAALGKPIVFLADYIENAANSFFVRAFATDHAEACLYWGGGYEQELLRTLAAAIDDPMSGTFTAREQRSNVDTVIADLRRERSPHRVNVGGMPLTVLPGVLSPRFSHSPDLLISKWAVPSGARVLDLGCGSGVLGLAALRQGAASLVATDINPEAIRNTELNAAELGLGDRANVRLSDGYGALRAGEQFDIILFAAPYWNRPAADDLEKFCFDENYHFLSTAISEGHRWLAPAGRMYVIFADQGDVVRALRIIEESMFEIDEMHLFPASHSGGHIRIIWELVHKRDH